MYTNPKIFVMTLVLCMASLSLAIHERTVYGADNLRIPKSSSTLTSRHLKSTKNSKNNRVTNDNVFARATKIQKKGKTGERPRMTRRRRRKRMKMANKSDSPSQSPTTVSMAESSESPSTMPSSPPTANPTTSPSELPSEVPTTTTSSETTTSTTSMAPTAQ